jgi:hypothetical protein
MKTVYRLGALVAAGITMLAFAGNALATQKLEVSQTAAPSAVTIKISQAATDPAPAKITVYVPTGYVLNATQATGSVIGTTSGNVIAHDLGNIQVPLAGDVIVDNPANHLTDPCAPGAHQGVWILRLTVLGQSIALPVYVDPTAGTESALGAAKLQLCFGSADTPPGTPGRDPVGAQLLDATFTVNGVLTPPTSAVRWIAFTTPYTPNTGTPNIAGTVEARSLVGPGAVSLNAKVTSKKKREVTVSGRVTQAGLGVAGRVSILINGRAKASATANANGSYSKKKLKGTGKRSIFQARVTVAARDITSTGCETPTLAGVSCVSATAGGFTATSRKVTVRF